MTATTVGSRSTATPRQLWPGITVVVLAVGLAWLANLVAPAISALTVAIVLGVVVGNLPVLPAATRPGLAWATRRLLRVGVVFLGLQLAVPQVLGLGAGTLLTVLATVVLTFAGTLLLGRALGLSRGLSMLVGTGFAICGASAVAAMEGVVERDEEDVATAIALVTLYGSLAIVALPLLAGPVGLAGADFGRWSGASVHEVAQVVAAASPAGAMAVATAVVVKLSRVVLLAPLVAAVSMMERRRRAAAEGGRPPLVPLFVLGFLAMVLVRSTGAVPDAALDVAKTLTTLLLAGALFGLGSGVRLAALVRTGPRALLLGLLSTLLAMAVSWSGIVLLG
ncbi:membrane protein [Longimycelium tulufanense]|uniref:Membrane protein n=1 Tax=Longimycelium tulufanense TaxID=907463 RepID=A0A8J3CA89_9PSEU|nr:membrane protein [Longimycelium tulufanense]